MYKIAVLDERSVRIKAQFEAPDVPGRAPEAGAVVIGFRQSLIGTPHIIRGLMPDSEAAKAGLREGDTVNYGVALDALQGEVDRTLTLQVTRSGKTSPITYLPRGEAVDTYQWERIGGIPEDGCKVPVGSRK
jgi:hypothetical protein